MSDWKLRDCNDERMKRDVYDGNEYRVPEDVTGWRIVDVGAHVGTFVRLCLERGAAEVVCVEPDLQSMRTLMENLADHRDKVKLVHAAVWDRDCIGMLSQHTDSTGRTLCTDGVDVECVKLDRVLSGEVDFLKIDAEGAEYSIIGSSRFPGVKRLAIEFHGAYCGGEGQAEESRRLLRQMGFRETRWDRVHPEYGLFWLYGGER